MAVGATFVIITGGIDLSVGSVYCLAAVCGAMFLHHFGPHGAGPGPRPSGSCRRPSCFVWAWARSAAAQRLGHRVAAGPSVRHYAGHHGHLPRHRLCDDQGPGIHAFPAAVHRRADPLRGRPARSIPVPMLIMLGVTVLAGAYLKYTVGRAGTFSPSAATSRPPASAGCPSNASR